MAATPDRHADNDSAPDNRILLARFVRVMDFAARMHAPQRRKTGNTPYIVHPIGVAHIIANEGGVCEYDVLELALLHDTVEDTPTTLDDIEREFGADMRALVAEVSDNKDDSKVARKRAQIEHVAHASRTARIVKLADKIYNLRDLIREPPSAWSIGRVQGYFAWSHAVYTAGLRGTCPALDAVFEELMTARFRMADGTEHPVLRPNVPIEEQVGAYYALLDGMHD